LTRSQRGVRVAISDSGPGIRPDMRDKVFEMFFTTRPEGTGLGLFMAKAAVENCGGTVTISDAETGGACFRVDLPDNLASKKER
jgi:two-component system NtrC family sensor kinase